MDVFNIFGNLDTILEVAIIIIPVLFIIFLLFKFVVPKRPAVGIGLAAGVGLLGAFLVKKRLKNAFDVEKQIAEHNKMMAEFKEKQKNRYNAVMANKQVIATLEKQRKKLAKNEEKYRTEIELIDAELRDRREHNERLLKSSEALVETMRESSQETDELTRRFDDLVSSYEPVEEERPTSGTTAPSDIEIGGYRLLEA
ncbi:MAG: hypothetical protein ACE5NG_17415 [bacterium]